MVRNLIALGMCLAALGLASCGGGDDNGNGAGGEGSEAKVLQPAEAEGASGNVTWCIGKDTSGAFNTAVEQFNQQNPKLTAKLLELPESADIQREQQIQRLRAESSECDVLGMDVIWTAEYAASGWLYDLTSVVDEHEGEFIPSTVETVEYEGKKWALPFNTNAGFLFYRTDEVPKPPASWEDVYAEAQKGNGHVYQGERYEGLTVNFLELLYSAGGKVLSDDGETVEIDSPEAREVLDFMGKGVEDGAVTKAVTTYEEESSRRAFEAGKATFMRNWPYAYALGNKSKIKGKFKITTLPGFGGNPGAGVLGGTNLAISAYSKNPGGALAVVNYFTSGVGQRLIGEGATPPATTAAYKEPSVRKAIGLPDEIEDAVAQAKPRPVSPVYPQISQAIYKNVNQALSGQISTDAAVKNMSSQIQKALQTF
jgi:multiple sugar transport system substrate-binding protein